MLEEKSIVKLSDGISLYGGETHKFYVFNTLSGDYFSTNAFGYSALIRVDGKTTIGQIVDDSVKSISVNRETFLADVIELFDSCMSKGVLELV